jgi:hypothetical protein
MGRGRPIEAQRGKPGRSGLTDGKGMPSIWQIAVEMPLVADHVHIASPPWPIQRAFLALIRPVARLLGYRPFELEPAAAAGVGPPRNPEPASPIPRYPRSHANVSDPIAPRRDDQDWDQDQPRIAHKKSTTATVLGIVGVVGRVERSGVRDQGAASSDRRISSIR